MELNDCSLPLLKGATYRFPQFLEYVIMFSEYMLIYFEGYFEEDAWPGTPFPLLKSCRNAREHHSHC